MAQHIHTLMVIITLAIAFLLLSIPSLSKNSIIVPNLSRRMLNFCKNLSAAFNSFAKNPRKNYFVRFLSRSTLHRKS